MKKAVGCFFLLFFFHASWAIDTDISHAISAARTAIIENRNTQAQQELETLLQIAPDNVDALFLSAYLQIQTNKLPEAQNTLTKLVAIHPNTTDAYNNLAWLHAKRGELDAAIDLLQKGINTQKSYVALYANLTRIYQLKASQAYSKALDGIDTAPSVVIDLQPITALDWSVRTAPVNKGLDVRDENPALSHQTAPSQPDGDMESAKAGAMAMVGEWAKAWSEKNIKQYLSFYDDRFQPPQSLARHLWERQRRDRIVGPKFIHVEIDRPTVEMAGDSSMASVTFYQIYRSDNINQRTKKLLVLRRQGDEWRILNEYSES